MKNAFKQFALLLLLLPVSCKDKNKVEPEAPSLSTGDIFTISGRGTVISGTVSSEGGYKLSEIGIVYGTSSSPTVEDIKEQTEMDKVKGYPHEYSVLLRSGLPSGTIYYRAYAIGDGKAFYGNTKRSN